MFVKCEECELDCPNGRDLTQQDRRWRGCHRGRPKSPAFVRCVDCEHKDWPNCCFESPDFCYRAKWFGCQHGTPKGRPFVKCEDCEYRGETVIGDPPKHWNWFCERPGNEYEPADGGCRDGKARERGSSGIVISYCAKDAKKIGDLEKQLAALREENGELRVEAAGFRGANERLSGENERLRDQLLKASIHVTAEDRASGTICAMCKRTTDLRIGLLDQENARLKEDIEKLKAENVGLQERLGEKIRFETSRAEDLLKISELVEQIKKTIYRT